VTSSPPDSRVERLLRDLAPHVLGAMVRRFRDFASSEDAVQEALTAAAVQWPRAGIPDNPGGWLVRVAQRRIFDHLRSDSSRRKHEAAVAEQDPVPVALPSGMEGEPEIDPDDTLRTTSGCERTTASKLCAPTCWNALASVMQRWDSIAPRRRRRRTCRREGISS
jgi:predicted RNA polymerase sigma factor